MVGHVLSSFLFHYVRLDGGSVVGLIKYNLIRDISPARRLSQSGNVQLSCQP